MRDKGMCLRGHSCRFLHDPKAIAEARALRCWNPQPQVPVVSGVPPLLPVARAEVETEGADAGDKT
eukprot:7294129-Alexandrium_andersonii.AAC.1